MRLLEVREVTKRFGGLIAVKKVDLDVGEREIVGLVGPNGAGKTTLLNIISGIYHPDGGRVWFCEEDITGLRSDQICKRGIGRTFQIIQPLPELTVLKNVMVGALFGKEVGGGILRFIRRAGRMSLKEAREKAEKALKFVGLIGKRDVVAKDLNVVELKRLELARALATEPKLLLLDEVTTGLNPRECDEAIELIKGIRDSGVSVLIVEHVMKIIMRVSDRIAVLHHGEKIAEGLPREIANDARVIKAYLGERYAI
jgi:branched-chain amino acid transport system ATP-binding protein